MSKPTYALPSDLFPKKELLEALGSSCVGRFEQEVRARALKGYENNDAQDKELVRFMKPEVPLGSSLAQADDISAECIYLGSKSWLASSADAPFIPQQCSTLVDIYNEPRSLAHLIGASFSSMRIVYIAENLKQVSLYDIAGPPTCELLMIIVEKGVTVSLHDEYGIDQLYARSILAHIGEGANVRLTGDHSFSADAYGLQHDRWYIKDGAVLTITDLYTGAAQSWLRKEFILHKDSSVDYTWLAGLSGENQVALTTMQEHLGASSSSSVVVKAALSQEARSFYRGMIRLEEQAVHATADQQQRALLLSTDAKTCAIPALEVATHEVRCAHGSAAGTFSEDELWYLQVRGLNRQQAEQMLLEGFFTVDGVPASGLRRLKEAVVFQPSL